MIKLELVTNPVALKLLLQRDSIYKEVVGLDSLSDYAPDLTSLNWFHVYDDSESVGVFCIDSFATNCLTFHAGLYIKYRNTKSKEYLEACLNYIRGFYPNVVFITTVKSTNVPAKMALLKAGYVLKTTIKNASLNGDIEIYAES